MVNCQKIITERWPQIDLYFLSKPEVEKKTYSRGNVLRNFNMVCILSDVNKIYPNLTFRSSRTPSVCQYKHQSLGFFYCGRLSSAQLVQLQAPKHRPIISPRPVEQTAFRRGIKDNGL